MLLRIHNWLQARSYLTRSVVAGGFVAGLVASAWLLTVNRRNLTEWDLTQPQATLLAAVVGGPFILLTALAAIHNQRTTMLHEREKFNEELSEQRRQADEKVLEERRAESRGRLIPLYTELLEVYWEVATEFEVAAEEAKMQGPKYTYEQAESIYKRFNAVRKKLAHNVSTQSGILLLVDDVATDQAVTDFREKVSLASAYGSTFDMSWFDPGTQIEFDYQQFYDSCQQIRSSHRDVVAAVRAHLVRLASLGYDNQSSVKD